MNNKHIEKMSRILSIASDKTRLKILCCLKESSKSVKQISETISCSQSLVSHQLVALKEARLVSGIKKGNFVIYSLNDFHILELINIAFDHILEGEDD